MTLPQQTRGIHHEPDLELEKNIYFNSCDF